MLGFGHSRGGRRAYRGTIDSPRGESIFVTGVPKSIIRCAVARLKGEHSQQKFNDQATNDNALASAMVAFSNSSGGKILVGVTDNGDIIGVLDKQLGALNQLIANVASQMVRPAINPLTESVLTESVLTESVLTDSGLVVVI